MNKKGTRISFALPFLVLVGCAAPKSVSLDPDLVAAQLRQPVLACSFEFDGITDEFDQRRVQGYWFNGTDLENLSTYIDDHIGSWLPRDTVPGESTRLEVALYRLSSESKSTATFFNVVLRVRAGNAAPEYLRGRYSPITWFGTPEEFQVHVQRAVNEALTELHDRLESHCSQSEPLVVTIADMRRQSR